ncbi:MAG: DASS family sodium-coupled anion symporter [Opitutaceae bacterium]
MSHPAQPVLRRWAVVLLPALVVYFVPLVGLSLPQRHLLAIFVGTIVALVVRPVPMGVSALLAATLLLLTNTLTPEKVLSGFGNTTVWLIFSAFLFARAITTTGLGVRIAYLFISRFGRTSLTLGYSVAISDLVLAPMVPSDTARGGGIMAPIVRNLAAALDSEPGPTANRIGAYLTLVAFHCTYAASAMFLTGMAANPLIASFAHSIAHVEMTWGRWALAASVPGLCTFAFLPWLLHELSPPLLRDTHHAQLHARAKLRELGPMQRPERILTGIMLLVMVGWISAPWHGLSNTTVALAGVCIILLVGVVSWDELLGDKTAWDALIWFALLLMMAEQLSEQGVVTVISQSVFRHVHDWPWPLTMVVLVVAYLYAHYTFASMTAHVTALYPSFLAAALAAGVPAALAVWPLAFFSNLNAGITHYGTGSAPIYFGAGYVSQSDWWTIGFIVSVINLAIWFGVGLIWWRVIGLW